MRKFTILAVAGLALLLALGTATAGAHRGGGKGLKLELGAHTAALVTEAAAQLDVPEAELKEAIADAAAARIDDAVEEGDLSSERAAKLKAKLADNLRLAIAVSKTSTVAANLDLSTAELNDGFRAARKALLLARIDEAVAEGDLSAEKAAKLKERLADAKLPGYKLFSFRR